MTPGIRQVLLVPTAEIFEWGEADSCHARVRMATHQTTSVISFFGGILEIGHDYFQTSRDRCVSELLLEIRHRMDFYTEIGTNSKYYCTLDRPKAPSRTCELQSLY